MKDSLFKLRLIFTRREKVLVILLFMGMLIGALLEVVGIGAIPVFVMLISQPDEILSHKLMGPVLEKLTLTTQKDLLIWGATILIAVFILKNIYIVILSYFKVRFVFNKQFQLSSKLFRYYMQAPYTFHLNKNSAELLRNVHSECNMIIQQVLLPAITFIMDLLMSIAILGLLIFAEPIISISTFGFMGLSSGLFLKMTHKKISAYGELEVQHRKEKNKTVLQSLSVLKDIKVLNRGNYFASHYAQVARESADALRYKSFAVILSKPFIETIAIAGILMIVLLMVLQGRPASDVIPLLALFGASAIRLMPLFNSVINSFTTIKYGIHSIDPVVNDLTKIESLIKRDKHVVENAVLHFTDRVILDQIIFRYPNSKEMALNEISMQIQKGESIGFVGSSGAGKTTLVDLVLGILQPSSGKITVDGRDIKTSLLNWQRKIGYIPQQISLIDDSITNNIALGIPKEQVNLEQVKKAAQLASLHEFILEMPEQYNTKIGERGVRLSGGQRQRIGIARSLYHEPEILVMDEATSALDNITEQVIVDAINSLKNKLTIIIIAHRLTTIKDCDKIFLLKNGKLKSSGTYQELIDEDSEFQVMAIKN